MTTFTNIDELEEFCGDLGDCADALLWEATEEHQLILEGYRIHILQLNIDVYPALWFNYFEELGEFTLDYDVFLFFPVGENAYVYSEGYSNLQAAIHNYLSIKKSEFSLGDLTFEVIKDLAVKPETEVE